MLARQWYFLVLLVLKFSISDENDDVNLVIIPLKKFDFFHLLVAIKLFFILGILKLHEDKSLSLSIYIYIYIFFLFNPAHTLHLKMPEFSFAPSLNFACWLQDQPVH